MPLRVLPLSCLVKSIMTMWNKRSLLLLVLLPLSSCIVFLFGSYIAVMITVMSCKKRCTVKKRTVERVADHFIHCWSHLAPLSHSLLECQRIAKSRAEPVPPQYDDTGCDWGRVAGSLSSTVVGVGTRKWNVGSFLSSAGGSMSSSENSRIDRDTSSPVNGQLQQHNHTEEETGIQT